MRSNTKCAFFLLTLAFSCALAFADDEVALRSHQERVQIAGRLATTTLEQVYVNYTEQNREAVLRFSLPPDAAVRDMAMWVDGLRSPAAIHPRVAAANIYRQIVNAKRDPALLQYLGNGMWQLQLFPIPPKGTQKVQIVITQLLRAGEGLLTYASPRIENGTTVAEAQELDFQATIDAPGGVTDVTCPSRKLGVQQSGGQMTLGYRAEQAALQTPFTFSFKPGKAIPEVMTFRRGEADYFVGLLTVPRKLLVKDPQPRDWVFVLDASASIPQKQYDLICSCLSDAINRLGKQARLGVVIAASDVQAWKDKLQDASPDNRDAAGSFMRGVKTGGGTDLAGAMRAAAKLADDPKRICNVVILSDGEDTIGSLEDEVLKSPATQPAAAGDSPATSKPAATFAPPANCRFFLITSRGEGGLESLCERTGGMVFGEGNRDDLAQTLQDLTDWGVRPVLSDIHCELASQGPARLEEVSVSDFGGGRDFVVAGRHDRAGKLIATFSAKIDNQPIQAPCTLEISDKPADAAWGSTADLGRVWASVRGQQMWRDLSAKPEFKGLQALVELSKSQHVLVPPTAFLVLETDQDYLRRGIDRPVSTLEQGQSLVEQQHVGGAEPSKEDLAARRKLRQNALELERLGKYGPAADAWESLVKIDPDDVAACSRAAMLREFDGLVQSVNACREEAQPTWDEPWYSCVWLAGPVDLVPMPQRPDHYRPPVALPPPSLTDPATQKKLSAKIPKVDFEDAEFSAVVTFLREAVGVNIYVNWTALDAAGLGGGNAKTAKVSLHLKDVTLEKAMNVILSNLGGGQTQLSWAPDEGVIQLSTREDLSQKAVSLVYDVRDLIGRQVRRSQAPANYGSGGGEGGVGGVFGTSSAGGSAEEAPAPTQRIPLRGVPEGGSGESSVRLNGDPISGQQESGIGRVYDVHDLLVRVPNLPGPVLDLSQSVPNSSGRSGPSGGSGGGSVFGTSSSYRDDPRPGVQKLIDAIQAAVDPESWKPNGQVGSISELDGRLVILQTPAAHRAIADLLTKIRKVPPVEVLDTGVVGAVWPEAKFSADGHVRQWVVQLLAKAREGKLSPFSSVLTRKVGDKLLPASAESGSTRPSTPTPESAPWWRAAPPRTSCSRNRPSCDSAWPKASAW